MLLRPSVFCAVDLSEASRGALRYAAAIAEHFYASLHILAVDELLTMGGLTPSECASGGLSKADLDRFVRHTFSQGTPAVPDLELDVVTGKPAVEILRVSRERQTDLIVMSSHGATGVRKVLFGSTTERVLRDTTIPVLITPADDHGPPSLESLKNRLRRILVPVDLSDATARQVRIARGLAEAFDASLTLLHVVDQRVLPAQHAALQRELLTRHGRSASGALERLRIDLPSRLNAEVVIDEGDPAEEIAREAIAREAALIVMGLHSVVGLSPRMGTVTYRVLCRVSLPIVALPPVLERRPVTRIEPVTAAPSAEGLARNRALAGLRRCAPSQEWALPTVTMLESP